MNKRILINISVVLTCFISIILCIAFNNNANYNYCCLFPIPFIIIYTTYFMPCFKKEITPFKLFFCILLYLRYVILPISNCIYGNVSFSKNAGDSDSYLIASIITIFELVAVNIFLVLYSVVKSKNNKQKQLNIIENKNNSNFVIWVFILLVFGLFIINRSFWNSIYFIAPTESVSVRFNRLSDIGQLIVYLFNIAKQFLFLIALEKFSKKYSETPEKKFFLIALVFIVFNILVYTGTNRAEFIITIIATGLIVFELFPKFKKIILIGGTILAIIIIPMISSFRKSNIVGEDLNAKQLSEAGNSYMSGIDNVALSIETAKTYTNYRNFTNFLYDMTRGIMVVGSLVKNDDNILTSRLFNYSFFGPYSTISSQIIPMSGQGYYYFDIYGFYLIEILFVYIAIKLEKRYFKEKDIKIKYFMLISILRLAMMQCLNGTILFNRLSYDLLVPIILIKLNNKLLIKKEKPVNEKELN
ncbi:MAG: hypothetical protein IJH76_04965 [Clostridia bacterium]|nr:hypothetical protein [Clostridia bacterium]